MCLKSIRQKYNTQKNLVSSDVHCNYSLLNVTKSGGSVSVRSYGFLSRLNA